VVRLAAWRQAHGKHDGEVNESTRIVGESRENIGAGVMGRNMFGPIGGGAWGDEQWTGWWGDNPLIGVPSTASRLRTRSRPPSIEFRYSRQS
jgi:hypothetical protein